MGREVWKIVFCFLFVVCSLSFVVGGFKIKRSIIRKASFRR